MSELKSATDLLDEPREALDKSRLAVEVSDVGSFDTPRLRFVITGFDFGQAQFTYNIHHVLYMHMTSRERDAAKPKIELYSKTGEIWLTFGSPQAVTEDLMVELAKVIGADALGFPGGHVVVTISRHE